MEDGNVIHVGFGNGGGKPKDELVEEVSAEEGARLHSAVHELEQSGVNTEEAVKELKRLKVARAHVISALSPEDQKKAWEEFQHGTRKDR